MRKEEAHRPHSAKESASVFKRYPVLTASAGTGVAVAGLLTALFWGSGNDSYAGLKREVEAYKAAEPAIATTTRHNNIASRIEEVSRLVNDPAYSKLPQQDREFLQARLNELNAYQEYQAKLAQVSDPKTARNEEQLEQIEKILTELAPPPSYAQEWSELEPFRRREERLADCTALKHAVSDTKNGYLELLSAGRRVLETASQPNLPARARSILERANQLPQPKRDDQKLIPGSKKIKYAIVFEFPSVADLIGRQWKEMEERLRPLVVMP